MPLSERDNYLRTVTMTGPEWIPFAMAVSRASWLQCRHELEEVLARHPLLFPHFEKGKRDFDHDHEVELGRLGVESEDEWGCTWRCEVPGIIGIVVKGPLEDWAGLESWRPPDPARHADWQEVGSRFNAAERDGAVRHGGTSHGFLFMRLFYLRGYENLMLDVAREEPRLQRLIDLIVAHYAAVVQKYLELGVEVLEFADDLGAQRASMLGPQHFRRWVRPAYEQLMQPCRRRGVHVALHSDGYIMDIMDEILGCGVDIVNPQDLVNGIDALAREVKGRACIRLDIDRQTVMPFGKPSEVRALLEEEVRKLGSPRGGLEFIVGIYPPTPAENVEALCSAMEEFRTWWWDGRARGQR